MALRFVKRIVLFLLPLVLVVAGVNYYGDAANVFTAGYEKALASVLLTDHHATELSEFNDRLLQVEVVKQRKARPQIAIIGSSRTLLLNELHFHPSSTFNHSMYAAAWFDLESMFKFLRIHGQLPDTLVIGIDPWTFNPGHVHAYTHTWLSHLEPSDMVSTDALWRERMDRWSNLLSPSYFQASLKEIPRRLKGKNLPIAVDKRNNEGRTRCSDGSMTYDPVFASTDSMQVAERIQLFLRGPLYGMNGYDTTDKAGFDAVQKIVLEARTLGVYAIVFFPPVAPEVFNRLTIDYPLSLLNEARFREWCLHEGLEVRGSFDPNQHGLDFHHFYDGIHMNEEGVSAFFEVRKVE